MLDTTEDLTKRLRHAFGCFASGVTVIGMRDGADRPTGLTVNSFSSLSLEPALLLYSVGKDQISRRWIEVGTPFTVNVLSGAQEDIAWRFAKPVKDKFDGVAWHEGVGGAPVIEAALASFECRVWAIHDGGDHDIVVGEIHAFETREGDGLSFFRGRMGRIASE